MFNSLFMPFNYWSSISAVDVKEVEHVNDNRYVEHQEVSETVIINNKAQEVSFLRTIKYLKFTEVKFS